MKKIITTMALCISLLLMPGADVLAETQTSVDISQSEQTLIEEAPTEVKNDSAMYDSEESSKYQQDFEKLDEWYGWILFGAALPYMLILSLVFVIIILDMRGVLEKYKLLPIGIVVVALGLLVLTSKLNDELNFREDRYKASLVQSVTDAYIKDHGVPPITGEFIGAGETNLLYRLNIKEMANYELVVANLDLSGYYLEDVTGDVYTGSHGEFEKHKFNK